MGIVGHTLPCFSGGRPTRSNIPSHEEQAADHGPRLQNKGSSRAYMIMGLHGGEVRICPIPGTS